MNQEKLIKAWEAVLKMGIKNGYLEYFFDTQGTTYKLDIMPDDMNYIQYVSKNALDEIVGLFTATVNREHNYIESLTIVHLIEKHYALFVRDIIRFLDELFVRRCYRKIVFKASYDNPAVSMYKKFVEKYKIGKVVGIFKEQRKLIDGQYHDEIYFEMYRENFIEFFKTIPMSQRE